MNWILLWRPGLSRPHKLGMSTDPIYLRALERLQEISKERRELEDFIATYRKLAGVQIKPQEPVSATLGSPRKPASSASIVEAAMEVLATKREPMKLGALYEALCANGFVIGGKEPRNNLGAKLSADRRLQTYPGIGWWFADECIPGIDAASSFDECKYKPLRQSLGSYEEGPDADATRPLQSNGAADWSSAAPRGDRAPV